MWQEVGVIGEGRSLFLACPGRGLRLPPPVCTCHHAQRYCTPEAVPNPALPREGLDKAYFCAQLGNFWSGNPQAWKASQAWQVSKPGISFTQWSHPHGGWGGTPGNMVVGGLPQPCSHLAFIMSGRASGFVCWKGLA